MRFAFGVSSLGDVLVAATSKGISGVLIGDERGELIADIERRFPGAKPSGDDSEIERQVSTVVAIIDSSRDEVVLPLDVHGTAFQQRVWRALREIPSGETATYSDVAEAIGAPKSVRAVASACGANSIAVLIPCHRVVRKGGGISGYRWGVERKRKLLERESLRARPRGR